MLPIAFFGVFIALVIEVGKASLASFLGNFKDVKKYDLTANKLRATLGYLTLTSNFLSCLVMVLVLKHIKKATNAVSFGRDAVERKRKTNLFVTAAHICLILGYTIVSILNFNVKKTDGTYENV